MRILLVTLCLFASLLSLAQKNANRRPVISTGFYLSLNPTSIVEVEQGAIGLGAGYRFSKRFEVFTVLDYLYKGFFQDPENFINLHGFRSVSTFKYFYSSKHGFFTGIDLRIKHYSFTDRTNFQNLQLADTLIDYSYKASHTLIGAGVFWGKRFKLTNNGRFEMEGNIGVGVKQRTIDRKNVPEGYSKIFYRRPDAPPTPDTDAEETYPYFPGVIRFIYHL